MTTSNLNKLVIEEAKALKAKATKEEIIRLELSELEPTDHKTCIYGQMTGSCFSGRATELIEGCATKLIFGEIGDDVTPIGSCNTVELKNGREDKINGNIYFSPIEMFIAQSENIDNGNVGKLIDFLKGESKTLKFE